MLLFHLLWGNPMAIILQFNADTINAINAQ